jgi:hypothetical protein
VEKKCKIISKRKEKHNPQNLFGRDKQRYTPKGYSHLRKKSERKKMLRKINQKNLPHSTGLQYYLLTARRDKNYINIYKFMSSETLGVPISVFMRCLLLHI